jgi:NhaP-type Na+/H+ or K+/H+ antiporter
MSEYQILTVLAAFAFLYSAIASRLERTPLSDAVVYLFVGLACGTYGLGFIQLEADREAVKRLAEFTWALVAGSTSGNETTALVVRLPLQEIGIGVAVGIILAIVGSMVLKWTGSRGWLAGAWIQVPVVALAMCCVALAQWLGGSGFIGAFVGGLLFSGFMKNHKVKEDLLNGAESTGDVLSLLTWFTFGAVVFGQSLQHFSWQVIVYALLSLTIVRMLPVFVNSPTLQSLSLRWK